MLRPTNGDGEAYTNCDISSHIRDENRIWFGAQVLVAQYDSPRENEVVAGASSAEEEADALQVGYATPE
jgi:hypothetical protein